MTAMRIPAAGTRLRGFKTRSPLQGHIRVYPFDAIQKPLASAFIGGLQGDDPKYYKTIATSKHYAVHSGPEQGRLGHEGPGLDERDDEEAGDQHRDGGADDGRLPVGVEERSKEVRQI